MRDVPLKDFKSWECDFRVIHKNKERGTLWKIIQE